MKKILLIIGVFIICNAKGQDTCTNDARNYVNTNIIRNGVRLITAPMMNVALNKIINAIECVDGGVFVSTDSNTVVNYDVLNSQNTPPVSPSTGDVYLVGTVPTGAWVGHPKDVAEWNGSAWVFTDGIQGDFLYNATTALTYIFRSGNWVQTTGIPALNNGNTISSGLTIGTNNARSLNFETNNIPISRFDSIGRFYVYDTSLRNSNKFLQIDSATGRLIASAISANSGGQSALNDSITAVRSIRKVDTIYRNLDSIVFKINGSRYSFKDSSGTSSGGTVTSVSVVTANGISGTVANSTTTPAITLIVDTISKFATRKQLLDSIDRINTAINTKQETLISGTNIKTVNSNSILGSGNITVSGDSSSLSGLIAATSANTINNSAFTQEWQWNSLTSGNGLKLSSSSTGASGNSQSILLIQQTGANADASQTTFGAIISNTKTGATSKSVALKLLNNGSGESLRMQSTASLVPNYLTYYNSSNALTAEIGHANSAAPTFFYINSYLESIIFKVSNIERFRLGYDGVNTSANYINVTSPNFISYSGTGRFYSTNGDEYSFQANNAGSGSSAFFGALSGDRGCLRTTGGQAIIWNNNQQVSINQNTVNASAQFQVDSQTRGVLLPRMTTTQKNAISSPAEGLEVYDLTLHQKSYYNGTTWINY